MISKLFIHMAFTGLYGHVYPKIFQFWRQKWFWFNVDLYCMMVSLKSRQLALLQLVHFTLFCCLFLQFARSIRLMAHLFLSHYDISQYVSELLGLDIIWHMNLRLKSWVWISKNLFKNYIFDIIHQAGAVKWILLF